MSKIAGAALKRVNLVLFETYKKLHGDLLVPAKFVIPNDPSWPTETHGVKLGNYITRVRESEKIRMKTNEPMYNLDDINKLLKLGLEVDLNKFHSNEILKAFQTYKEVYNTTVIGKDFKIPSNNEAWPKSLWNRNLYNQLCALQNKPRDYIHIRPEISMLGFDLTRQINDTTEFEHVLSALQAYRDVYKNLLVKYKFVVPFDDVRFPHAVWGMKLGNILFNIRSENLYTEHRTSLEALGVEYETTIAPPSFRTIYSAIKSYVRMHGDVNKMNQGFVIPQDSLDFHSEAWGMKLGNIVHSMRSQGTYQEFSKELLLVGINVSVDRDANFKTVYEALSAFKAAKGHLMVPRSFEIRHEDANFPKETWGLKLGTTVKRIRTRNYYRAHKQELLDLGFVYHTTATTATAGDKKDKKDKKDGNIVELD